jgi:hypothetical protein
LRYANRDAPICSRGQRGVMQDGSAFAAIAASRPAVANDK